MKLHQSKATSQWVSKSDRKSGNLKSFSKLKSVTPQK